MNKKYLLRIFKRKRKKRRKKIAVFSASQLENFVFNLIKLNNKCILMSNLKIYHTICENIVVQTI